MHSSVTSNNSSHIEHQHSWEKKAEDLNATTLPPSVRDLLFNYYDKIHSKKLSNEQIASRLNLAREEGIKTRDYPCLRGFRFATARSHLHPFYKQILNELNIKKSLSEAKIVDIGCCFGTDLRQFILDGFKPSNCLGLELEQDFIRVGLDILFEDRDSMKESFIACDILADDVNSTASLMQNKADIVYSGSLYHLLSEQESKLLTKRVYLMLSDDGGIFFGRTIGSTSDTTPSKLSPRSHLFTKPAFIVMLEEAGFKEISVELAPTDKILDLNNNVQNDQNQISQDNDARMMFSFMAVKKDHATTFQGG